MTINISIKDTEEDIHIYLDLEGTFEIDDFTDSVVIPIYNGNYVMTYHPQKKGWKFPSGMKNEEETIIQCAERETFEETGAILLNLKPIGYYLISDKEEVKIVVFIAEVEKFEPKPRWSETDLVKLFDKLPDNILYKDEVYKIILQYLEKNK